MSIITPTRQNLTSPTRQQGPSLAGASGLCADLSFRCKKLVLLAAVLFSVGCVRLGLTGPPKPATEHSEPEAIVINGTKYKQADLESLRGLPFIRVIEKLGLEGCEATFWVDEPPGQLRGMYFFLGEGLSVTLFLDDNEPMFKAPTDRGKWDCGAVFLSKVGGVTARFKENELDVGNVPWQWLPLSRRK